MLCVFRQQLSLIARDKVAFQLLRIIETINLSVSQSCSVILVGSFQEEVQLVEKFYFCL